MGLKLGKTVLVEIVGILQKGLLSGVDVSQQLRDLELKIDDDALHVELSDDFVARRNEASDI